LSYDQFQKISPKWGSISPVSFDYYDRQGNHLNPTIKKKVLFEEQEISKNEITRIKEKIFTNGKSFLQKEIDAEFYNETIIPILEDKEPKETQYTDTHMIVTPLVNQARGNEQDIVYHKGDLHISDLHCLAELKI